MTNPETVENVLADDRLLQIRRAHAFARPNASVNPAWANTHGDLSYALAVIDRLATPNQEQPNE